MVEVDPHARQMAIEKFALPDCLHLPIAARSEAAITRFIGEIVRVGSPGSPNMALLVEAGWPYPIDERLPIWGVAESQILRRSSQLWVHVDYRAYRQAYIRTFQAEDLEGHDVDHIMNRHVARLKGFEYVRVVPILSAANRSSGGLSEKWAIEYHSSPAMKVKNLANPAQVQMADLADIVKMLNLKTGGAHQDPVNDAQSLVRPSA